MAFLVRLLVGTGLVIATVVITALCALAIVWIVNRVVQTFADALGVEVTDFFDWLRTKLPKKKEEKK